MKEPYACVLPDWCFSAFEALSLRTRLFRPSPARVALIVVVRGDEVGR